MTQNNGDSKILNDTILFVILFVTFYIVTVEKILLMTLFPLVVKVYTT